MSVETISCVLVGPGGVGTLHPVETDFEVGVNSEVRWSARLAQAIAVSWAPTDVWTLKVASKSGAFAEWTSPALVCLDVDAETRGGAGPMTIGGKDLASHLLSAEGVSMPTIQNNMASDVISAIAAAAGTSVSYVGSPVLSSMRLAEYDVQGSTESYGTHISRILRDAGCNWRPAMSGGGIEVFPMDHDVSLGGVVVGETRTQGRRAAEYSQVVCRKSSKQQGEFNFTADATGMQGGDIGPVGLLGSSIAVADLSTSGSVGYVAFYSGAGGSGSLVGLCTLNPQYPPGSLGTANPALAALSAVWSMHPPQGGGTTVAGRLRITGSPPSAYSYDPAFTSKYPETDSATRKRVLLIESPLWPTKDFLESNNIHRSMLWEANKSLRTVRRSVLFTPYLWPGGTLPADSDASKARYDSVSWHVGAEVSCEVAGFVVPW